MSFHLETNKQSEIVNQEIEKHFCTFINYQQDDWADKLPIVEFATNNNDSLSTKLSPFFASRGLYPRISFDIINFLNTTTHE